MKMMSSLTLTLLALPLFANAEVFECKSPTTGEMIYQSSPCPANTIPKGELKIKELTPQQKAAADAELKAEEQEESAYESTEAKAAKQRQNELQKREELELEERRTRAAEDEAETNRRRLYGRNYPY